MKLKLTNDPAFLAECAQMSEFKHHEYPESYKNIKEKLVLGFEVYKHGFLIGCAFISKIELPCCTINTIDGFRIKGTKAKFKDSIKAGRKACEYAKAILHIPYLFILHRTDEPEINMLGKAMGFKNLCTRCGNEVYYNLMGDNDYYAALMDKRKG